jgi:GxxExxY protein
MADLMGERDGETHAIIGAAMAVHCELGHGFLEAVHREALRVELGLRGIGFQSEAAFALIYRDRLLRTRYRADLLCFGKAIVEVKALQRLGQADAAQLINYLKASGMERGLLLHV